MAGFQPRNANYTARVTDSFRQQPFARFFGCELRYVDAGLVHISLSFMPHLAQQNGQVHGGIVTSIVDAAAGFAAMTLVEACVDVMTTKLKVNFLRSVGTGLLVAKGRVIKPGRKLILVQADVTEHHGKEIKHVLTGLVTAMTSGDR